MKIKKKITGNVQILREAAYGIECRKGGERDKIDRRKLYQH